MNYNFSFIVQVMKSTETIGLSYEHIISRSLNKSVILPGKQGFVISSSLEILFQDIDTKSSIFQDSKVINILITRQTE